MVDGRPYYTLSSYDPVQIEIYIPQVTDEDVNLALETMVERIGGTLRDLDDPQWLQAHFRGAHDLDQLRSVVRSQVSAANNLAIKDELISQSLAALARRLVQRVPDEAVEATRKQIRDQAEEQLKRQGHSLDEHAGSDTPLADLMEAEALAAAEQEAALEAFVNKRRIEVGDDELPGLLGSDEESAKNVVESARKAGKLDELRAYAVKNKACQQVVSEARITWHHETDHEAAERAAQMRAARSARTPHAPNPETDEGNGAGGPGKPNFKLV